MLSRQRRASTACVRRSHPTMLVGAAVLGLAGCSGATGSATHEPPVLESHSASAAAEDAHTDAADPGSTASEREAANDSSAGGRYRLGLNRSIGQMLMTHVTGVSASPELLARVRSGKVGSVILYSENIIDSTQLRRLTASLQNAAREGGNPPLLIATDQEGGTVKRLRDAPPTMSAAEMGASRHPFVVAEGQGLATGEYLRRVGINVDLAPVSDIPNTADNFLGTRAFGHNQRSVVEGASGFASGLAQSCTAGTAKHFPGLGDAGAHDTDLEVVTINATKPVLRAGWAPYRAMARLGPTIAPLVMISNAIYPAVDRSGLPATLSPAIVKRELGSTGMGGRVVITDDLEVPAVERYPDPAVKGVLAGDDILMFAERESGSERAYSEIQSAVARHAVPRSTIMAAAERVETLKEHLAGC